MNRLGSADSPLPATHAWEPVYSHYHWGEPELGYYRSADPFVIRRHASMLADAGVDVVFFDTSNAPHTWVSA